MKIRKHFEWYTSLNIDAMYYKMATKNLQFAKKANKDIQVVTNKISKLDEKEKKILAKYNGDYIKAYEELEPIAITIVDHLQYDLEEAYKPYLESISLVTFLCAASLESYINIRAEQSLSSVQMKHFDKLSLEGKWLFYPKLHNKSGFDPSIEPFQGFTQLVKIRNKLVHYKHKEEIWESGRVPKFLSDLGLELKRAEQAIITVKSMLKNFADQFGEKPPDWIEKDPLTYFTFYDK